MLNETILLGKYSYHLRRLCVSNKADEAGPDAFPPPALPRPFLPLVGRGPPNSLPSQSSEESSSEGIGGGGGALCAAGGLGLGGSGRAPSVLVGAEAWLAEGCGGGTGCEDLAVNCAADVWVEVVEAEAWLTEGCGGGTGCEDLSVNCLELDLPAGVETG